MSNAEALTQMTNLKNLYSIGHKAAAIILSKEIGADFFYLYWLPRNHDAKPNESILYIPKRRAAIEHTKRKMKDGEN